MKTPAPASIAVPIAANATSSQMMRKAADGVCLHRGSARNCSLSFIRCPPPLSRHKLMHPRPLHLDRGQVRWRRSTSNCLTRRAESCNDDVWFKPIAFRRHEQHVARCVPRSPQRTVQTVREAAVEGVSRRRFSLRLSFLRVIRTMDTANHRRSRHAESMRSDRSRSRDRQTTLEAAPARGLRAIAELPRGLRPRPCPEAAG